MRICVVQAYGLGNGILTTPLVQALVEAGHEVDVLLDRKRAAWPVFVGMPGVGRTWDLHEPQRTASGDKIVYDVAVFAHPATWHKDCLRFERYLEPRVEPVEGKDYMWWFEKHEVETLVDLARELGFEGELPPLYLPIPAEGEPCPPGSVAIGIGYLKQGDQRSGDQRSGDQRWDDQRWDDKHWGNDNYAGLCRTLIGGGFSPVLIGDAADRVDAEVIVSKVADSRLRDTCGDLELPQVFGLISQCVAYVGNDTGNMHVAAACDIKTLGIFTMTNAVKNSPWCSVGCAMQRPTVDEAIGQLEEWGLFECG